MMLVVCTHPDRELQPFIDRAPRLLLHNNKSRKRLSRKMNWLPSSLRSRTVLSLLCVGSMFGFAAGVARGERRLLVKPDMLWLCVFLCPCWWFVVFVRCMYFLVRENGGNEHKVCVCVCVCVCLYGLRFTLLFFLFKFHRFCFVVLTHHNTYFSVVWVVIVVVVVVAAVVAAAVVVVAVVVVVAAFVACCLYCSWFWVLCWLFCCGCVSGCCRLANISL